MAYVLDYNIVVSKFKLPLHIFIHLQTNTFQEEMNPFISMAIG